MEYLFQADINGSLERLERIENDHEQSDRRSSTEIILQPLRTTLKGLETQQEWAPLQAPGQQAELQDPSDVCQAVLFKAWIQRTDALSSFSVSRYSRGVLPNEYYHIIETLNFTSKFKISIYSLDPEVAATALQELLPHIETCRLYDYLPTYLRVYQSLHNEQACNFAFEHLRQHLSLQALDTQSVQQLLSTLFSIYESDILLSSYQCIGLYSLVVQLHHSTQDILQKHLRSTWKRLLALIHGKYNTTLAHANMDILPSDLDNPILSKSTRTDMDDARLWNTDSDMIELWNKSSVTTISPHRRHEYAFELVCRGIWQHAAPSRNSTISYDQLLIPDGSEGANQRWSNACDVMIVHLSSLAVDENIGSDLYACMKNCMEMLKSLSGSWKSIVKAMTQFSDIWIRILPSNDCMVAFADLIVIAGTWTCLYRFVVNVINARCEDGLVELVNEQQKSSLCALVHMVIKQLPTNALLELIYDTYSDRSLPTDNSTSSPLKLDLFNDMATLQKCCNQLVHTEQEDAADDNSLEHNQVEPRLLHQLTMLAVLSPYEIVWRLVNHGIENKGQHGLVVSILRQLGDLCMLQRHSGDQTLFGHIIGSILLNSYLYTGLDILAPMLLSCWKYVRNPSISLLLDSYATITCNTSQSQIIIHPKELFDSYLLPALQQTDNPTLTNDILGLFYALTEDTSPACDKWQRQLDQHVSYIPILLDMRVAILMKSLAGTMDKRYSMDGNGTTESLSLSMALDLGRKLTMTIRHVFSAFKHTPELLSDVKLALLDFYDGLGDYDWRTRLFWQDSYSDVVQKDQLPLYLPSALVNLLQTITYSVERNDDFLWYPDKDMDMDTDLDQSWILLLNGCRTSTLLTNELFKFAESGLYHIDALWNHPHQCPFFHEQLVYSLHPAFTTAAHYEYRLLLIHFLGRLYDAHGDSKDVMRNYPNDDPTTISFVQCLTTEHCRIFFMALHSLLLLKTPSNIKALSSTMVEDGELYYVSGIVQTIQAMTNWQQLGMDGSTHAAQSLTRKQISAMALDPANKLDSPDNTKTTADLAMPTSKQQDNIIDCAYPWMNDQRRSGRALYLLMIQAICQVSTSVRKRQSYDLVRVLLLQMVEGLENRLERDTFMDHCHSKQTKSWINKWKKNKRDNRIRVHLRPLLSPDEMNLISLCHHQLPVTDDQTILHNLLTLSSTPSSPILYIYNSHS